MKIRPVGAELFYAEEQTDGRTDMTKLRVAFRDFANALKKLNAVIHAHRYGNGNGSNVLF
jgi:hypothetical protein